MLDSVHAGFAVMAGCAALVWLAGCSFEGVGSGQTGATLGNEPTGTTAMDSAGTTEGGVVSGTSATSSQTDTGTAADDADTTAAADDSDTTSPSDGSESSGGLPDGLIERGLVTRYFLDEAASGKGPALAMDAAPAPLHLPIDYAPPNPSYVEVDGNRGLSWDGIEEFGAPLVLYDDTKLMNALQGHTAATIEVVADIQAVTSDSSRVSHFGNNMEGGGFTMAAETISELRLRTVLASPTARWPIELADSGRTHYTIVFDSNNPVASDRALLYANGVPVEGGTVGDFAAGAALAFNPGGSFVLGNRAIGQRSFEGVLFYAALYNAALTPAEVMHNADILGEDDDTPP